MLRQNPDPSSAHGTTADELTGSAAHAEWPSFEASCRPLSWSLYGLHLSPSTVHSNTWADEDIEAVALATHALGAELGSARVWWWCPGGLPSPKTITTIAGAAALRGVPLERLGLDISLRALCELSDEAPARIEGLRAVGIDVAVRLRWADLQAVGRSSPRTVDREARAGLTAQTPAEIRSGMPLERAVQLCHMRGLSAVIGGMADRRTAHELGATGVAAVLGPAVAPPLAVAALRAFLGPCEPWIRKMQADSI